MKLFTLCYVEKDDHYLMLHRNKKENDVHQGKWVGLGGKFEPGESPEECVVREVLEESGLHIKNPQLRGILTFPGSFKKEDGYVFVFTAREFTGELIACPEGELAWVKKRSIKDLPMHEADHVFIDWMNQHPGIFSGKFNYENGVCTSHHMIGYGEGF